MTKICTRCKKSKNIDDFSKNRSQSSGLDPQCKDCHKEKQQLRRDAGLNQDREREYKLNKKYGITLEDWNRMHDDQNGRCPICLRTLSECSKICVDHDHITNEVRGLLCSECNLALGGFKDNKDYLARALAYLGGGE